MPGDEKLPVVAGAVGFENVTVPGPLTFDQVAVTWPGGVGRPSSVTEPCKKAVAGRTIDWGAPAFTMGAAFSVARMVTSLED